MSRPSTQESEHVPENMSRRRGGLLPGVGDAAAAVGGDLADLQRGEALRARAGRGRVPYVDGLVVGEREAAVAGVGAEAAVAGVEAARRAPSACEPSSQASGCAARGRRRARSTTTSILLGQAPLRHEVARSTGALGPQRSPVASERIASPRSCR